MSIDTVYDSAGNFTLRDPNITTTNYTCLTCHRDYRVRSWIEGARYLEP